MVSGLPLGLERVAARLTDAAERVREREQTSLPTPSPTTHVLIGGVPCRSLSVLGAPSLRKIREVAFGFCWLPSVKPAS
jgi:hypothetical protein